MLRRSKPRYLRCFFKQRGICAVFCTRACKRIGIYSAWATLSFSFVQVTICKNTVIYTLLGLAAHSKNIQKQSQNHPHSVPFPICDLWSILYTFLHFFLPFPMSPQNASCPCNSMIFLGIFLKPDFGIAQLPKTPRNAGENIPSPPTGLLAGRHLLPAISSATAFHNLIPHQKRSKLRPQSCSLASKRRFLTAVK